MCNLPFILWLASLQSIPLQGKTPTPLEHFSPFLDSWFCIQIQVNYSDPDLEKAQDSTKTISYYLFCSVSFCSSGSVFSSKMQMGSSGTTSSTSGAGINSCPSSADFSSGPDTPLPPYLQEL